MNVLSTEDLRLMIENTPHLVLIDVLPIAAHREHHLPGAINVPLESGVFVASVEALIPNKNQPVVVYCANRQCDASTRAAHLLAEAGYRDVYDYEDGIQGWQASGLALRSD